MEKQGKTLHCKGHIASITLVAMVMFIFFIPIISAWEFDNRLYYEKEDMKVSIENAFGLGETLGTVELKSHSFVDEVLQFGYGAEEVVMYYDNVDLYGENLGEVIFTNERTGKIIDKDYYFVEWKKIDVPNYIRSCEISYMGNGTKIETCGTIQDGTKQIDSWVKLKNNIIPDRNTRIGLKTFVEKDDYVDAIWTIAGKEITKHSSWTASLNVDLTQVWDFNEGVGTDVNEKVSGVDDGVLVNSVAWMSGANCILDGCIELSGTDEYVNVSQGLNDWLDELGTTNKAWCIWYYTADTSPQTTMISMAGGANRPYFGNFLYNNETYMSIGDDGGTSVAPNYVGNFENSWNLVCNSWNFADGNLTTFINGNSVGTSDDGAFGASTGFGDNNMMPTFGAWYTTYGGYSNWFVGRLDDIFFWSRELSHTEMEDMWNGGSGIEYVAAFDTAPVVTLNNPPNNTVLRTNEISLNCTGSDDINLVNVSLILDGVVNETNTPANNTLTNFDKIVSAEEHNWTCRAADNNSLVTTADIWIVNVSYVLPTITLSLPINTSNQTTSNIYFNATVYDDISIVSVTFILDGEDNETNSTVTNNTVYRFDKILSDAEHNWSMRATDDDTNVVTAGTRFLNVDTADPLITISSPTNTTYTTELPIENNVSTDFNWITTDVNLDKCWYSMDEGLTNTTITCNDNVTIYTTYGTETFTAWANDTYAKLSVARVVATLDYFALINSINYTQNVYVTEETIHSTNITANSSLTSANLHFNGTRYTGVQSGTLWNYTLQVPTTLGNVTLIWELTYAGNTYNTTTNYQTVNNIQLGLCNATLTVPYTNISFKNEETLVDMNATIDASEWNYWLGDGTYTKQITYSSSTNFSDYRFCFNPGNKTLHNNRTIQYSLTGFPQRRYTSLADLTNVSTNTTLYLLASADGIYVTFQTINTAQQAVSNVEVNASRTISGSTVIVSQGVTDSAGLVTFWLNPNYLHSFTFDSDSYDTYTLSLTPTQSSYTVNLGGTASDDVTNYHQGILVRILPVQDFLTNNTEYDFILNLTSDYWEVSVFGFSLYYGNATLIGAVNASTNGGNITIQSVNVSGDSIYLTYFYIANGTTINSEQARWWGLEATIGVDYSITKFFENFGTHLDSGLFGATDFTRLILSLLIIVMVVGGVSYNFGIRSEATIGALLFGLIFILDVGLEFIPSLTIGGFTPIPHFLTFATALILFAFLIKEARS